MPIHKLHFKLTSFSSVLVCNTNDWFLHETQHWAETALNFCIRQNNKQHYIKHYLLHYLSL